MPGLVTIGETMGLLSSPRIGPLRHATSLTLGIGGAESNVAIGVARLGVPACWVGRVGSDAVGDLIVSRLAGEGVDVSHVVRDPDAPTSLMLKEQRTGDVASVVYYRRGGPGARLTPQDVPRHLVAAAGVVHVTGITPALSDSARQTVEAIIEAARSAAVPVSLDVNYRRALWSVDEARPVLRALVARVDVVFAGDDEAELLGLTGPPEALARRLAELGPREAVVKLGARGAVAVVDGVFMQVPPVAVRAVDTVGAGDAFVAGYLAERLAGAPAEERLRTAAVCGAFAVMVPGDWEGLPDRRELAYLSAPEGTVVR